MLVTLHTCTHVPPTILKVCYNITGVSEVISKCRGYKCAHIACENFKAMPTYHAQIGRQTCSIELPLRVSVFAIFEYRLLDVLCSQLAVTVSVHCCMVLMTLVPVPVKSGAAMADPAATLPSPMQ